MHSFLLNFVPEPSANPKCPKMLDFGVMLSENQNSIGNQKTGFSLAKRKRGKMRGRCHHRGYVPSNSSSNGFLVTKI